ncbi:hypothetical protein SALBM217S_02337 [Streptomyces griseoloalbus]
MDHKQVSHAILMPVCAASRWTAERYKAEAERRRTLRAERKPLVRDARKALAVARKADPERTKPGTHKAERELRQAQRAVPDPMWLFTAKTAAVVGAAGYVGLPHVPESVWLWSAVAVPPRTVVGAVVRSPSSWPRVLVGHALTVDGSAGAGSPSPGSPWPQRRCGWFTVCGSARRSLRTPWRRSGRFSRRPGTRRPWPAPSSGRRRVRRRPGWRP